MSSDVLQINLNNRYEYNLICSQKNLAIFDAALYSGFCPSRINVAVNLVTEITCFPFYLACKIATIAQYFFSFFPWRSLRSSFSGVLISHLMFQASLQFNFTVICTVIRLTASILGLVVPYWALRGWRLAEKGEELSYQLILQQWQTFRLPSVGSYKTKEIYPNNALFYLGWKQTLKIAHRSPILVNKHELDSKIRQDFLFFLREIFESDRECFHKMLIKDQAIDVHTHFCDKYNLDSFTLSLLTKLEDSLKIIQQGNEKVIYEEELIKFIITEFTTKEMQHLFYYIHFNLQHAFLQHCLQLLNQSSLVKQSSNLKNLFSTRLKFGRFPYLS